VIVRYVAILIAGSMIALIAGCGSGRPALIGSGYQIDDIKIEGATRFSQKRLLKHLFMGETNGLPFSPGSRRRLGTDL
jgi:hypothetical protein